MGLTLCTSECASLGARRSAPQPSVWDSKLGPTTLLAPARMTVWEIWILRGAIVLITVSSCCCCVREQRLYLNAAQTHRYVRRETVQVVDFRKRLF